MGYLDFLVAMKNSRFIMTDSGGIQEEATAPPIHRFVLVLREKTDRPEAVAMGFAKLAGTDPECIIKSANSLANGIPRMPSRSPYGDGRAAVRIVDTINNTEIGSFK
jgi:UDP-N-acetylglucosamine 2-epimerase